MIGETSTRKTSGHSSRKIFMAIKDSPVTAREVEAIAPAVAISDANFPSWAGPPGRFTSSAWAGIYWEAWLPAKPDQEADANAQSTNLEGFLMHLMYGE